MQVPVPALIGLLILSAIGFDRMTHGQGWDYLFLGCAAWMLISICWLGVTFKNGLLRLLQLALFAVGFVVAVAAIYTVCKTVAPGLDWLPGVALLAIFLMVDPIRSKIKPDPSS